MAAKDEERLPADWTAEIKFEKNGRETKYYMNVRTGQKFFSKEDLLRYVKMKRIEPEEPYPADGDGKRQSENSSSKLVAKEKNHENSRGRRHSENRSSKLVAKESNHENSRSVCHSENSSMRPVAEESNHENSRGKRRSENSSTKPVAEENNHPECLPDGWVVDLKTRKSGSAMGRQYKVYIEPLTGCKFFSMPEVLRHLESVKNINSECKRKTTHTETSKYEDVRMVSTKTERKTTERDTKTSKYDGAQKVSTKTERETTERDTETSKYEGARKVSTKTKRETTERVVVEKSTVDDLPPGWIKETKIKKTARGIRKDPYYTDPVTGYVFISKKDVFRYLETGQISKYAFKPRKEGDDPEQIAEETLPSPGAKRQKLEHTATKRELFPVRESSDICIPAVSKAEVLKKRRGKELSAETGLSGAATAEISPQQTAKMEIDKFAETKEISSLSGSALPKFRGSKRKQGKMVFAENGSVSTPVTDSLQGQRLLESHFDCSYGKILNDATKSAKKKKLNSPLRSSKRLAGLEPERLVNEVSQHLKTGLVPEPTNHVSSSGEPSNKFKSSGSQAIPGELRQKLKSAEAIDDKSEQVSLFFGDSFLDPCLESAFKALMGELPVNYNPDNGPVLNPAANSMQTTGGEKTSSRKTQINSKQSKSKKELNLPRRSSKRLSGFEPEMVAECESLERAPKNVTTESCKSKGFLTAGLTSSGLADEVSLQLKSGPVLGLPNRVSEVLGLAKHVLSEGNILSSGDPLNKIKSSENLALTGGQSAEVNGDKSEPHASLGDSCLHPCKAMIGETLVVSVPDNELVSTTAADILPDKESQETKIVKSSNKKPRVNWMKSKNKQELNLPLQETRVVKSSNKKTRVNSMKSKNKQEVNLPRRSSKRLAGIEPQLVSLSVAGEEACGNATIEFRKSEESSDIKQCVPADSASQQVEAGHETMLAQCDCSDIGTTLLEESSDKNSKPLEAQIVSDEPSRKLETEKPGEQPQKLENERTANENPDSENLFPFGDSWSDPCLEFAFKTLTGAIPVDENLAIQGYLQHQLGPSNSQKDDSSALPDFGPINSFRTDVSHPFDAPEKQIAPAPQQQQLPANPFLTSGDGSIPSFSSTASQQPCLDGNKELQGKAES